MEKTELYSLKLHLSNKVCDELHRVTKAWGTGDGGSQATRGLPWEGGLWAVIGNSERTLESKKTTRYGPLERGKRRFGSILSDKNMGWQEQTWSNLFILCSSLISIWLKIGELKEEKKKKLRSTNKTTSERSWETQWRRLLEALKEGRTNSWQVFL